MTNSTRTAREPGSPAQEKAEEVQLHHSQWPTFGRLPACYGAGNVVKCQVAETATIKGGKLEG